MFEKHTVDTLSKRLKLIFLTNKTFEIKNGKNEKTEQCYRSIVFIIFFFQQKF